jgi:hypothetical protein
MAIFKNISLGVTAIFINMSCLCAQDISEAFRLSNTAVQGTARSIGFGNALGSIGGDFSGLSTNPAGIGVYRSSEISFTPSININSSTSTYANLISSDNTSSLQINQLGLVFTNAAHGTRYDRRKWKSISFAVGMNTIADFNQTYNYHGLNNSNSITQVFESDANLNKSNVNDPSSLGYIGANTNILSYDTSGYKTKVPFANGLNQSKSVATSGSIKEYLISFGGNYNERILLGVSLGMPVINYEYTSAYTETLMNPTINNPGNFNYFKYNNDLRITGGGINLKLGAILKPTNFIRIGASFHSPTYYTISDQLDNSFTASSNGTTTSLSSPYNIPSNQFNYNLVTPWKGVLSASFIIKNFIFITADYEYQDYSTIRYEYSGDFLNEQNEINTQIRNTYKPISNIRIGGEMKLGRAFYIRCGAGYYGNPYRNGDTTLQKLTASGGLGFHFKHFFTDFGYIQTVYTSKVQPYQIDFLGVQSSLPTTIPQASVDNNLVNIAWTVGYKF